MTSLRITPNTADAYGARLRALLTAPATGAYTFWLAGDDDARLFLSTNADPANRAQIATVDSAAGQWTNDGEFDKYPGQKSATINLVAGQQYFIEAFMKEGGGGDNLSVAWTGPGIATRQVVPGSALSPTALGCTGWCPGAGVAPPPPPPPPPPPSGSGVTVDRWATFWGRLFTDIATGTAPTSTSTGTSFAITPNTGDGYGVRVRALLTAPATGAYTFWVASDDQGALWLSTNGTAAARVRIAQVAAGQWTTNGEFDKYPGQKSATINLVAGQKYFIEAFMKEDGGGDNLSVAWTAPGIATRQVVPASALSPTALGCTGWCPT